MIPIYKRRIAPAIILSFLTGGIWTLFWEYLLLKNTRAVIGDSSPTTGEYLLLLFVPFYSWYWLYTRGETVRREFMKRGYPVTGSGKIYLILGILGLSIVAFSIMQHDFNTLPSAEEKEDKA